MKRKKSVNDLLAQMVRITSRGMTEQRFSHCVAAYSRYVRGICFCIGGGACPKEMTSRQKEIRIPVNDYMYFFINH